jgi:hypothetical protein
MQGAYKDLISGAKAWAGRMIPMPILAVARSTDQTTPLMGQGEKDKGGTVLACEQPLGVAGVAFCSSARTAPINPKERS